MDDTYQIFAIRYGHLAHRNAAENFIVTVSDEHDVPMPLDYFVWAIVGERHTFLLDTGFDEKMGRKRNRQLVRPVAHGLQAIGIDPAQVTDIIISHMHFDHAGNPDLFPQARYHIQDEEMAFCTGRCMCHAYLRHAFDVEDVSAMIAKLYAGRVIFHDGSRDLAPGISVHCVGGHTRGLQIVRVKTRRGWVVLGSDAAHFYANFEQYRPFPVVENVADMLEGYDMMRRLATSIQHIIPGHDPLVLQRYPAAIPGLDAVVRLDLDPLPAQEPHRSHPPPQASAAHTTRSTLG